MSEDAEGRGRRLAEQRRRVQESMRRDVEQFRAIIKDRRTDRPAAAVPRGGVTLRVLPTP